nr:hypothetical protein [uncultured Mucilaginibacter sp.]
MPYYKNNLLLITACLIFAITAVAKPYHVADSSATISITYNYSNTTASVRIDIYKKDAKILLVYNVKAIMYFLRDTTANNEILKKGIWVENRSLPKKYRGTLSDTVETNDASLNNIINKVLASTNEELERPGRAKNTYVIDGTLFGFDIAIAGDSKRKVYAHSPNEKTQPILKDLLNQVFALYYKSETNGYLRGQTAEY